MLSEKAAEYYTPVYDLNCAEAILYAANEIYGLNLQKETLHAIAGFGGGMAIEETCGALTGAVAVLGIMLVEDKAHESDLLKAVVTELFKRYELRMGTINCKELKDRYREEDPVKCRHSVTEAAKVLEELLKEYGPSGTRVQTKSDIDIK
jgi:C_GCAxxG_C_C family probable redox protein